MEEDIEEVWGDLLDPGDPLPDPDPGDWPHLETGSERDSGLGTSISTSLPPTESESGDSGPPLPPPSGPSKGKKRSHKSSSPSDSSSTMSEKSEEMNERLREFAAFIGVSSDAAKKAKAKNRSVRYVEKDFVGEDNQGRVASIKELLSLGLRKDGSPLEDPVLLELVQYKDEEECLSWMLLLKSLIQILDRKIQVRDELAKKDPASLTDCEKYYMGMIEILEEEMPWCKMEEKMNRLLEEAGQNAELVFGEIEEERNSGKRVRRRMLEIYEDDDEIPTDVIDLTRHRP